MRLIFWLFIYASKYIFLIFWSPRKRQNLLNFLQGETVPLSDWDCHFIKWTTKYRFLTITSKLLWYFHENYVFIFSIIIFHILQLKLGYKRACVWKCPTERYKRKQPHGKSSIYCFDEFKWAVIFCADRFHPISSNNRCHVIELQC